jgi:hypothetical protein
MRRAVSLLFILAAVVAAPSLAFAQEPVLIDSPGLWTLHDLGYEDVWLEASGGRIEVLPDATYRYAPPVEYLLPNDAAQGPDLWYALHLHFELELAEDSGEGKVEVMARVNGRLPALVVFNTSRENHASNVNWFTTGMMEGAQEGTSKSTRIELVYSDYLSYPAVVPNLNMMEFAITEDGEAKFARLRVFADTSIEITELAPPELKLEPNVDEWNPAADVGKVFDVPFTIKNVGGWPATEVITELTYPSDKLQLLGEPVFRTPSLKGEEEVASSFKFQAFSSGAHRISFRLYGRTGGIDEATLTITVRSYGEVSKARYFMLVALVISLSTLPFVPFGKIAAFLMGTRQAK